MSDTPGNGTVTKAPAAPSLATQTIGEQIAAQLKATTGKIGTTKKTANAKAEYLSWVAKFQRFSPQDRETVLNDLRRLTDLTGSDGANDSALTAARLFVGSTLS